MTQSYSRMSKQPASRRRRPKQTVSRRRRPKQTASVAIPHPSHPSAPKSFGVPGRSPPRSVSVHMPRLAAAPAPRRRNAPLHEEQTRRPAPTSPHRLRLQSGESGQLSRSDDSAKPASTNPPESWPSSQDFSLSFTKAKSGRSAQRASALFIVLPAMVSPEVIGGSGRS
jgi:hypothetical protein